MTAAEAIQLSYAQYLALEEASAVKHEYLRGEAWAMAGGSIEHARLQGAMARELGIALRGKPCVVLGSDGRIRIDATDRTTYPDLSVVCGHREASPIDKHAIVNPSVIVEVLSEGTERDDRGQKFSHYRHLASLKEYVLVNQDARRLEVFRRSPDGWVFNEAGAGQELELRSLGIRLSVDAVYFDPAEKTAT